MPFSTCDGKRHKATSLLLFYDQYHWSEKFVEKPRNRKQAHLDQICRHLDYYLHIQYLWEVFTVADYTLQKLPIDAKPGESWYTVILHINGRLWEISTVHGVVQSKLKIMHFLLFNKVCQQISVVSKNFIASTRVVQFGPNPYNVSIYLYIVKTTISFFCFDISSQTFDWKEMNTVFLCIHSENIFIWCKINKYVNESIFFITTGLRQYYWKRRVLCQPLDRFIAYNTFKIFRSSLNLCMTYTK